MSKREYDLYASQFSPDGRVFQVEYAKKAVDYSGTAIALRGKDGIVFAVEKFIASKLYETGSSKRISSINKHTGAAVAGLLADANHVVGTARKEAALYRLEFGSPIPIKELQIRTGMYMHQYTVSEFTRPFGCSIMMASYEDDHGPQLFCIDPSGASLGYYGCAIGKANQAARSEIESLTLKDMTLKELAKEAARIIYFVHDDDNQFELEMSWVGKGTNGMHVFVPKSVFQEAEKYAMDALEDELYSD